MEHSYIQEAAAYIGQFFTQPPQVALILGSGLGPMADEIENPIYIDYSQIPHFPVSTAPGHRGRFVVGTLAGKQVLCMQGRFHYYEGYTLDLVTLPIRCMKALGIETVILTNASGGINSQFKIGDFMMLTDHINFLGNNPLIGPNDDAFGPRFCDMTYTYTPALQDIVRQASSELQVPIQEGVYLCCSGPSFETPAEIRAFRTLGADAVGMSTVPEAIVASHCGMRVLALSCITNMAAGILDVALDENDVVETASARAPYFRKLLYGIITRL